MAQLEKLFQKYDRLVIFDTETTGLIFSRDEIIEFAAAVVEQRDGKVQVIEENSGDENKKEVNENSNVEVKSSFPSSRAFVTVSEPEVTYKIPKNVLSVNISDLEAMITEKQTDENKDIVEYITSRI